MSDLPTGDDNTGNDLPLKPAEVEQPRRAASVRLRGDDAETPGALMDQANRALGDALRLTFRFLVAGMVALFVVYFFSGTQQIQKTEQGISILFGKPLRTDLQAGLHITPPAPFGGLVRVDTSPQTSLNLPGEAAPDGLEREFMSFIPAGRERTTTFDDMPTTRALNPNRDDHLITGDLNIVHGQLSMSFQRETPAQWATTIDPEMEGRLLRAVVRRAMILEVAETEMEEFLRPSEGASVLQGEVLQIANQQLAQLNTGIEIKQLTLDRRLPPRNLKDAFDRVQSASSRAKTATEEAERDRRNRLIEEAGQPYEALLTLIDRYETEQTLGESDADETLVMIDRMLSGELVEINGQMPSAEVGGNTARIIAEANGARQTLVQRAQGDFALYEARLEQYLQAPGLSLLTAWNDAYSQFISYPLLETTVLPEGASVAELLINRDPALREARLEEQNRRAAQRSIQEAEDRAQRQRFQSQAGIQTAE